MEIIEIISYNINHSTNTIEVKFRMTEDDTDEIRVDEIKITEADDFGYSLIIEDFDFYDEDNEDDNQNFDEDVDEDELKACLNEFYMIYPERLPSKDSY